MVNLKSDITTDHSMNGVAVWFPPIVDDIILELAEYQSRLVNHEQCTFTVVFSLHSEIHTDQIVKVILSVLKATSAPPTSCRTKIH